VRVCTSGHAGVTRRLTFERTVQRGATDDGMDPSVAEVASVDSTRRHRAVTSTRIVASTRLSRL